MAAIRRFAAACYKNHSLSPRNFLNPRNITSQKITEEEATHLTIKPEVPKRQPIEYEISRSSEEWKFVERIIPLKVVPEPTNKSEYPSGWQPPKANGADLPYHVERSKNHMVGVYLVRHNRGQTINSKIRKISGDIWALERELKAYLEEKHQKHIITQIQEVTRCIWVRGDYVNDITEWVLKKGM